MNVVHKEVECCSVFKVKKLHIFQLFCNMFQKSCFSCLPWSDYCDNLVMYHVLQYSLFECSRDVFFFHMLHFYPAEIYIIIILAGLINLSIVPGFNSRWNAESMCNW